MPSHLAGPWHFAISYLEMHYRDQALASGSGFFWKLNERTFLISNWHNFSGRNPETEKALSPTGGLPDRVKFTAYKRLSEPDAKGFFDMAVQAVSVLLYDHDLAGPRWFEHPRYGRGVDIAAIDVSGVVKNLEIKHVNEIEADAVLQPFVSQDVFIVGYPLGLITGTPVPVWKRGTIATDPAFDPGNLPKMYIDTASREGMSGSVVIAKHIIVGQAVKKKDGTDGTPYLYSQKDVVLGVYSGRMGADEFKAQLGIVWKRHVIEETLAGNTLART